MNKYSYKVINAKGEAQTGVVEARDEKQAANLLRARKLMVVKLRVKRDSFFSQLKFFQRVSMDDKVNFTRQLATMITSGLALTEALSILETQSRPTMGKVVGEVLRDIEGGSNLAKALEKHPDVFDQVFVALIRAGESAGVLDTVMNRLADNLESEKEFQSKIKGAMIYPIIITIGMVAVGFIMVIFVIPRLTIIYDEFEAELPISTKILLFISKFFTKFWWLALIMVAGGVFLFQALARHPELKKRRDDFLARIPIYGSLQRNIMLTELSRTLGLLIGAGVLVVDALSIVKNSVSSAIYHEALVKVADRVEKGSSLAAALAQTEVFPPLFPQMVAVGEETGKIDEVLGKISTYFEREAEVLVKGLTTAMEPLIMIVLGIGVAFMVISVIMPIYNLTSQF